MHNSRLKKGNTRLFIALEELVCILQKSFVYNLDNMRIMSYEAFICIFINDRPENSRTTYALPHILKIIFSTADLEMMTSFHYDFTV